MELECVRGCVCVEKGGVWMGMWDVGVCCKCIECILYMCILRIGVSRTDIERTQVGA